jgi:pimeloyl-ACP methyl ester carboxylesterase
VSATAKAERFTSFDGTGIAYVTDGPGDGPAVLLLHGFAADHDLNWVRPGIVGALAAAGHRVIALDARGHGKSDKPHDPAAYMSDAMPRDAHGLLDHLGVEQVDVVGYSMGSVVASRLVPVEPRTRRLVLGGVGGGLVTGQLPSADIADALLTDDPSTITYPAGKLFRTFAESTGADLHALWAIQKARVVRDGTPLGDIRVPTLVLVGRDDRLVGPPEPLAAAIDGATLKIVDGSHLTAVGDPEFPKAIVEFLA